MSKRNYNMQKEKVVSQVLLLHPNLQIISTRIKACDIKIEMSLNVAFPDDICDELVYINENMDVIKAYCKDKVKEMSDKFYEMFPKGLLESQNVTVNAFNPPILCAVPDVYDHNKLVVMAHKYSNDELRKIYGHLPDIYAEALNQKILFDEGYYEFIGGSNNILDCMIIRKAGGLCFEFNATIPL